jgi:hypothetical protein
VSARHLFVDQLGIVLGLVVIGPLLGTFTLLINTYYDMDTTDLANPRKQYVTVLEDLVDRESVRYAAWGFAGLGLLLAAFVSANLVRYRVPVAGLSAWLGGGVFLLLIALAAVLSFAYSHPSIRLKGVPGMDLLVNVLGFGVICPLAGWSLLAPVEAFPSWYLLSGPLTHPRRLRTSRQIRRTAFARWRSRSAARHRCASASSCSWRRSHCSSSATRRLGSPSRPLRTAR